MLPAQRSAAWTNYEPPHRSRARAFACAWLGHQWAARAVPIALEKAFCRRCGSVVPGTHAKNGERSC